jgi:putative ABC transport system permease protein
MQAFVAGAVSEVGELVQFGRLLGYLAVVVVVLVLGNTVWISARTRMGEMGVLQTVGATRPLVSGLVLTEGVVLALLGGLLGTAAVVLFLKIHPVTLGIEGFGIDLLPDTSLMLTSLAVSAGVGVLASIGPAVEALGRPLAVLVKPA